MREDNKLISYYVNLAKHNDEDACRFLAEHYFHFALLTAKLELEKYSYSRGVPGDYLSVYWKALRKSIQKYDDSKGSFMTLLNVIYVRMLHTEIDDEIEKNYALFTSVSLDDFIGQDNLIFSDVVMDSGELESMKQRDEWNYYSYLLEIENEKPTSRKDKIIKFQKMIILYKYCGFTILEIAKILNVSKTSIRRILNDERDSTPLKKLKLVLKGDDK